MRTDHSQNNTQLKVHRSLTSQTSNRPLRTVKKEIRHFYSLELDWPVTLWSSLFTFRSGVLNRCATKIECCHGEFKKSSSPFGYFPSINYQSVEKIVIQTNHSGFQNPMCSKWAFLLWFYQKAKPIREDYLSVSRSKIQVTKTYLQCQVKKWSNSSMKPWSNIRVGELFSIRVPNVSKNTFLRDLDARTAKKLSG